MWKMVSCRPGSGIVESPGPRIPHYPTCGRRVFWRSFQGATQVGSATLCREDYQETVRGTAREVRCFRPSAPVLFLLLLSCACLPGACLCIPPHGQARHVEGVPFHVHPEQSSYYSVLWVLGTRGPAAHPDGALRKQFVKYCQIPSHSELRIFRTRAPRHFVADEPGVDAHAQRPNLSHGHQTRKYLPA
mgnify:CR=1 FL=1